MSDFIETYNIVELATIILSVSATTMAVLVFLFTRKSFRAQALQTTHNMWHTYHAILLQDNNMELAMSFVQHQTESEVDSYKSRQLLIMLLNILYYEWSLSDQNLIDKKYASVSFAQVIKQLATDRPELIRTMTAAGFDTRFIELVADSSAM